MVKVNVSWVTLGEQRAARLYRLHANIRDIIVNDQGANKSDALRQRAVRNIKGAGMTRVLKYVQVSRKEKGSRSVAFYKAKTLRNNWNSASS